MKQLMRVAYLAARSEFDMIPERSEAAFEEWFANQDVTDDYPRTKEVVLDECLDYHNVGGMIEEGGRIEKAIYDAMEEFAASCDNQQPEAVKEECTPVRIYRDVAMCQKVEAILKPEYMNTVFTWVQIKEAILSTPPPPQK